MMMPIAQAVLAQLGQHHAASTSSGESGDAGSPATSDQHAKQTDESSYRVQSTDPGETSAFDASTRHAIIYLVYVVSIIYASK